MGLWNLGLRCDSLAIHHNHILASFLVNVARHSFKKMLHWCNPSSDYVPYKNIFTFAVYVIFLAVCEFLGDRVATAMDIKRPGNQILNNTVIVLLRLSFQWPTDKAGYIGQFSGVNEWMVINLNSNCINTVPKIYNNQNIQIINIQLYEINLFKNLPYTPVKV